MEKKVAQLPRNSYGKVCSSQVIGAVAQLVAHLHGMQGVRGSNPLSSTKSVVLKLRYFTSVIAFVCIGNR